MAVGVAAGAGVPVGVGPGVSVAGATAAAVGVGVAVAVAVGGALGRKRTSSTTSVANSTPRGRSIARVFALRASGGGSSGPVLTATSAGAGPATSCESCTSSCVPLPSAEAYQATRSHAASVPGPGCNHPLASYHWVGATRTVW